MGSKTSESNKGGNQCSFTSNTLSMIIWRRAFLVRYYKELGASSDFVIEWNDIDSHKQTLIIDDEGKSFDWKPAHAKLNKTTITVYKNTIKLFVIALYFSTSKILVQGFKSLEWEDQEYKPLSKMVKKLYEAHTKGNNNDRNVENQKKDDDKVVDQAVNQPKITETEQGNCMCKVLEHKIEENKMDIDNIRSTLHVVEKSQIEQDKSIRTLNTTCESILEKVNLILDMKKDIKAVDEKIARENKDMKTYYKASINEIWKEAFEQNLWATDTLKPMIEAMSTQVKELREKLLTNEKNVTTIDRKLNVLNDQNSTIMKQALQNVKEEKFHKTNPTDQKKSTGEGRRPDEDQSETSEEENRRKNLDEEEHFGDDIWIIGSSIVKDLNGNRMFSEKKVRVSTLHEKTLKGALQFIREKKMRFQPKIIKYQVGSNDLESQDAEEVIIDLENLIKETREIYPNSTIVLGEILPRFLKNRSLSNEYEENRSRYNLLVKDYCAENDVTLVNYSNMRMGDYYDGIHLNNTGIKIYVANMKRAINPLLGVTDKEFNTQRSDRNVRYMNSNRSNRNTMHNPRGGYQRGYEGHYGIQGDHISHFGQSMQSRGGNFGMNHYNRNYENQGDQYGNSYTRNSGNKGRENMLSLVEGLLREIRNN